VGRVRDRRRQREIRDVVGGAMATSRPMKCATRVPRGFWVGLGGAAQKNLLRSLRGYGFCPRRKMHAKMQATSRTHRDCGFSPTCASSCDVHFAQWRNKCLQSAVLALTPLHLKVCVRRCLLAACANGAPSGGVACPMADQICTPSVMSCDA
jgi:hypothetical protein